MKPDLRPLLLISGLMLAAACWTHAHAAPPQMKPGLWEYKMTMEMAGMPNIPGMPGMGGMPMTFTRCLKPEDIKDPQRTFSDNKPRHRCEQKDYKAEGNKVSFTIVCSGENAGTGTGEFTFNEDSFEGTMQFSHDGGRRGAMTMTQKMSGKRLGECKQ